MEPNRRRQFLVAAGALLGAPWARAQSPAQRRRIAFLNAGKRDDVKKIFEEPFLRELAKAGYVEGRNLAIERRYAEGVLERLPALARELVALKPELILAPPSQSTAALKATGTSIPVVFCFVTDPVAFGFAQSLARPGGNFTGLSNFSAVIAAKRVELLKEALPGLARLCAWYNPDTASDKIELEEVRRAIARFGMQFLAVKGRNPAEYDEAAAAAKKWGADSIYVVASPTTYAFHKHIVGLVAKMRLPAVYWNADFVEDGGLMSYAPDFHDLARRAATYADKILRGARPAELAIEQPSTLELTINLRAARAIGISLPQAIILRADRVIE